MPTSPVTRRGQASSPAGATLAEAARELAAVVESKAGQPLLAAVDAIQREVTRKRFRVSRKEIAAEVRATRAQRRRRG